EGISGFWKGNVFGTALYAVYSGFQFWFFRHLPIENNFVLGATSGCLATFVSYPLDVMRTRFCVRVRSYPKSTTSQKIEIRPSKCNSNAFTPSNSSSSTGINRQTYKGLLDAIGKTLTGEGIGGFYKGIGPSLMQIIPATGISLWTFERA